MEVCGFRMFWRKHEHECERVDPLFKYLMLIIHYVARDPPPGMGMYYNWEIAQRTFKALTCTSRWMRHLMRKLRFEIQPREIRNEIYDSTHNKNIKKRDERRDLANERRNESYEALLKILDEFKMNAKTSKQAPWWKLKDGERVVAVVSKDQQVGPWNVEQTVFLFNRWCNNADTHKHRSPYFTEFWQKVKKTKIYYKRVRGQIWFLEKRVAGDPNETCCHESVDLLCLKCFRHKKPYIMLQSLN